MNDEYLVQDFFDCMKARVPWEDPRDEVTQEVVVGIEGAGMVRDFPESFGSCCQHFKTHCKFTRMSRHLRDEVHVIYCEGTNDNGENETSGGQEKFVNGRGIILAEKSASFSAVNLRLRMLTGTEVALWSDHQNARAETMQMYVERKVTQDMKWKNAG